MPDSTTTIGATTIGTTTINFGFVLDPLTGAMAAMVTFVGLLIFIFSIGYMKDDPRMARFFCYLSLFAAGMLGLAIVLAITTLLTLSLYAFDRSE